MLRGCWNSKQDGTAQVRTMTIRTRMYYEHNASKGRDHVHASGMLMVRAHTVTMLHGLLVTLLGACTVTLAITCPAVRAHSLLMVFV